MCCWWAVGWWLVCSIRLSDGLYMLLDEDIRIDYINVDSSG